MPVKIIVELTPERGILKLKLFRFDRKKRTSLIPVGKSEVATKMVLQETEDKIKRGLSMQTASTGTPIVNLRGGAKFMAQLSNIGGGSKATGGGGIKDGFATITLYVDARAKSNAKLKNR